MEVGLERRFEVPEVVEGGDAVNGNVDVCGDVAGEDVDESADTRVGVYDFGEQVALWIVQVV